MILQKHKFPNAYLMNSREDLETLKTGNVYGLAISLIFSITLVSTSKVWKYLIEIS